jgi:RimJ/RimL family protein N-acetyltransferase
LFLHPVFFLWQGVTKFRAKIGDANLASQALFRKLGYRQVGRSEVFKEVVYELAAEGGGVAWTALVTRGAELELSSYN